MTAGGKSYYPVFLDVFGRKCLVAGGGSVSERKVKALLDCGARVTVVSPDLSPGLLQMAAKGGIEARKREYETRDLDGMFLVIGATDDEAANQRISMDARQRNMLVNIADRPGECSFILPSVVRQKDLVIAVSTGGKSPAFAKHLREKLLKQFGPEYGNFLNVMGNIRKKLLLQSHAPEQHKPLFERLINGGLLEHIRNNDMKSADALLHDVLGPGFSMKELMDP